MRLIRLRLRLGFCLGLVRHADCVSRACRVAKRDSSTACSAWVRRSSDGDREPWRTLRRPLTVLIAVGALTLALAGSAHADPITVLALAGSVDQVLDNIRNWLMGILAGLATVFLTVGGVRRVVGGGDPSEQEKAKSCFKNAAIGYGLAALAPLAITVLKSIVGA